MMQGLHQQQQQLAALLSAALPNDDSSKQSSTSTTKSTTAAATAPTSAAATTAPPEKDESSRLAAVASLHRAILYPPNSLLLSHSATLLSHGFSQLLSDKSYTVRQAAASAYGALCSVLCSIPLAVNGRQNHAMLSSLVDRFIGWALPLLSNVNCGDGTSELALGSLCEFLNVGEIGAIERYAFMILRACQELLEDERTSLSLLHSLLGVLTVISLKFFRCFEPHFVDIVDVLLGWAMMPDLADSDRHVIMDSFLQFQKYWVNNMQFSLGLLSKFLGDMDVLLQDGSPGTAQQFQRLLALLSCFSTVLQSTASGLLELNLLKEIHEPVCNMIPLLLRCLLMIGKKFGWLRWIEDSWRSLTLLAEILGENFATFYPLASDILFQSLGMDTNTEQLVGVGKVTPFQVHGVLKTNLQLLSLQKVGLLFSSVHKILQFDAPISLLRLHPNHLVTGSSAATYIFLLQHENSEVVEQAVACLIEELELLKGMIGKLLQNSMENDSTVSLKSYSKLELFALVKFDLKVLLSSISLCGCGNSMGEAEVDGLYLDRSEKLVSYITEKFYPFSLPLQGYVELQVTVLKTLERMTAVEFKHKISVKKQNGRKSSPAMTLLNLSKDDGITDIYLEVVIEHIRKYTRVLLEALAVSSPLSVKLEGLKWIYKFCESVVEIYQTSKVKYYPCEAFNCVEHVGKLLFIVLNAAIDREPKVRSHVASVLEILLQAKLVHPMYFYHITELVLEKLGDSDSDIKNSFMRLLSHVLPITIYICGLYDCETVTTCKLGVLKIDHASNTHWKKVFALKQLPQQLHSQQLVSILSYVSQRWKVPLSSWIQRLIYSSRTPNDFVSTQLVEGGNFVVESFWQDIQVEENILERVCSVNVLAAAWWAINESARYCITTRLRTNLGGPTQTFAALERMLLEIAHVLQLDTEQSDGNLNIMGSSGAHLLPMRLLLDFVEALKKNVYNAYDGSTVLPCSSRQSSLFFRANKKVCEEWFSRICEPMMSAGLALQCHYATIHYCTLRLHELRNVVASVVKDKSRGQMTENIHSVRGQHSEDILRVLRYIALALCKIHESESLVGLQKWATTAFSPIFIEENQSQTEIGKTGLFPWITGLIYQSRCQHEKAAAHFTYLLQNEESLNSMSSDDVQFSIARIIESYVSIADWKSLESWLVELQTLRVRHAGKSCSGALTTAGNEMNSIHALARFDDHEFQAAWAYLDLTPKSSCELTLDPKLSLQRSEQMLLQAMLFKIEGKMDKVFQELQKAKSMLEEPLSILPLDGIEEAAVHFNQLHCIFAFEDGCKHSLFQETQSSSLLSSYINSVQSPISQVNQDCSLWLKVLRVYQTILPSSSSLTLRLCKSLLTLARKQRNFMLANRLKNYLKDHALNCSEEGFSDKIMLSLQYEGILLMHAENKLEDAFANLWSFLRTCIINSSSVAFDADGNVLKAKACLKLFDWLHCYRSAPGFTDTVRKICVDIGTSNIPSFGSEVYIANDCNSGSHPGLDLLVQEISGTATKLSTHLCPTMGKSWISFASWCYDQARASLCPQNGATLTSCFFSSILASEVQQERFELNEDELLRVKSIVLKFFQENLGLGNLNEISEDQGIESFEHMTNETHVKKLLHELVNSIEVAAGAPGAEDFGDELLDTTLASQLRKCFSCAGISLEETKLLSLVDDLVNIWWSLRRRRVSLFGHAAQAFIRFLSFSSLKYCDGQLTGSGGESKHKTVGFTLRATLSVLNILLNYGKELKDTLEPALLTVPLLPWQEITPQLFARLSSHPQLVVRKQLESLLVMLSKLSPSSVIYPTLVDLNAYEKEPSEELQKILDCLKKLYPKLIQDVQLMIKELENVTVLWEELWLSTLQDLHPDVMRRINLLREEVARVAENATLSLNEKSKINAAKYSAMMAPIVVTLERRLASTSRKPETPHEMWFHQEYEEQIRSALLNFKTPPTSAYALGDVWRPFDNIAASLTSYQRKSSISLGEVAPLLTRLSSSDIPMPGLEKQVSVSESGGSVTSQGIVTIDSFSEQMVVLSTKTKPKKLVILGSDGQKYTYLLKGREDLRLDARIMQLLQAVNGFLHSSLTTRVQSVGIRYYSVTPISGRAGLIQWVDNVISIYSVYKSWQNRVQLAQISALGVGSMKSSVSSAVPRPSDLFYGKIIPALKEKGIRRVISRRDWPQEVKRKVLLDLMKETPKQLLQQELWCASEGFKAYSTKMKRYSGSVAAMSMVGNVLGLGDRHLDNILIDFCSGDILHIDYNVCFDKGQRLKIPEIVPFRLTQTMETALGLTGIEGSFRANCEAVLDVLKKNKDVLLMLLEVFVWDPLVEWTRGDFHDDAAIFGEERRGMELAVSLSLFASRMQEIRIPLQEHHDLLLATLPAVESALERFAHALSQYDIVSALFYRADQERSNLVLHETSAKSVVAEANCNSEKICASFEMQAREFSLAKAIVADKAQEATTWIEQHGRILDALRSSSIPEMDCTKLTGTEEALSLTSAVLVAGVPLTIVPEPCQMQCHDIDREVSQIMTELNNALSSAVTALQAYALALQRVLPMNYLTGSSVHGWAQVLQLLVNNLSSEILSLARRQASELISKLSLEGFNSTESSYNDMCLQVERHAKEIENIEEECAELVNSIGPETESRAKDRLLSSFMTYMQSSGIETRENVMPSTTLGFRQDSTEEAGVKKGIGENTEKVHTVLGKAIGSLYNEVKYKVVNIINHVTEERSIGNRLQSDLGITFCKIEEQIDKCILIAGFVDEIQQYMDGGICSVVAEELPSCSFQGNWASVFKTCLLSCKRLVEQMIEVVLPDVVRYVISYNSVAMDAFGSLSQIRGTIDTALEQLFEIDIERSSLMELEQNYFVKVGLITEQQLALEEAALKGRDHLSWEEAEELASQEETCRAQLEKLHQSWNQKDMRTASLIKRETSIKSALASSEHHFQSLIDMEQEREPHTLRSRALLEAVVQPLTKLELVDRALCSASESFTPSSGGTSHLAMARSDFPASEYFWKCFGKLNHDSFFLWKVFFIDSFLDACVHEVALSVDQNFGFDQIVNAVKRKTEIKLCEHIDQYLKERVAPILLRRLEKENELMTQMANMPIEVPFDQLEKGIVAVKQVEFMLEEFCNAHETARAARSAAMLMKRQVNELKEALLKTCLEIVQLEWMRGITMSPLQNYRLVYLKFLPSDDTVFPLLMNISRPKVLENLHSFVVRIAKSLEYLKGCERTSAIAEGQLERAMAWACGGPSSSTIGNAPARNPGIPPEFHEHLSRRRQLIYETQEKSSSIIKLCLSVLEFEASRDGILWTPGEPYSLGPSADGRAWQQAYLNALTRLDVSYHSFTCTEQEWKLAQSNMEAASSELLSASNELFTATIRAKSASGDLQSTLLAMKDGAYETSVALSAFGRVSRGHTVLTSECGSMLEEVLAITEGLHDVHSLGKDAAALHFSLIDNLSKANAILIPLESLLSKDVTAMTDAMAREKETKTEISPIHGQAIYQSYYSRIKEVCQVYKPLVPLLATSVKGLHSMLARLARAASIHAGNLHKALEGLGESQELRSLDMTSSRTELVGDDTDYDNKDVVFSKCDSKNGEDCLGFGGFTLQDKEWLSPPDSICSSSSESGVTSADTSVSDILNDPEILRQIQDGSNWMEGKDYSELSSGIDFQEKSSLLESIYGVVVHGCDSSSVDEYLKAVASPIDKSSSIPDEISCSKNQEIPIVNMASKIADIYRETTFSNLVTGGRFTRGKNAYAASILQRVEMKLDGRDIFDNRNVSVAEQVDYLLNQATSVDNLCNMYEGWTPWI